MSLVADGSRRMVACLRQARLQGRLPLEFRAADARRACPQWAASWGAFLAKHCLGNPGNETVHFERLKRGLYRLVEASAYPLEAVEVLSFRYEDDLHLTRGIEAVKGRTGEDANYLLGKEYGAVVTVKSLEHGRQYEIPIGIPERFLTDLSSVPWWGRWYVGRVAPHLESSVVHDWLYVAWQVEGKDPTERMREFADDVFRASMEEACVGPVRRWVMYRAVRGFGKRAFHRSEGPGAIFAAPKL